MRSIFIESLLMNRMALTPKDSLIQSLRANGFSEKLVSAFDKVKRERFVPEHLASHAYEDIALPIGDGATISQPYTIAFMLSLLDPKQNEKILEIGSGSGYVLALISEIIKNGKIYGVELSKNLAVRSKEVLKNNSNIEIFNTSGFRGLPKFAPYDKILVSAAAKDRYVVSNLIDQLKNSGVLVIPIKSSILQMRKVNNKLEEKEFPGFAFVQLEEKE